MKRTAARFCEDDAQARLDSVRTARANEQAAVRALFEGHPGREYYSVEVADSVGGPVMRAAGRLRRLELEGVLVSRLELSPTSGNGRRYYRLKG